MHEKCESCGTVFEVDESTIPKNTYWFKCGVCNKKWVLSTRLEKSSIAKKSKFKNKSEKVKYELASIKSAVEDKSLILAKKTNPVLEQKNKSVAEISSELSLSKLNEIDQNKKLQKRKEETKSKNSNILPFFFIFMVLTFSAVIFFRSTLISYSFLYFPAYTQNYIEKIYILFTKIELPVFVEIKNLNLINFIATVQEQEVTFSGKIKNISNRPMLMPRIKILGIREDRKIILEKTLILEDKIISPNTKISFKKTVKIKIKDQN